MKLIAMPDKKKAVLQSAVAGALLAWSAGSAAVDFSIADNEFTICTTGTCGSTSFAGALSSNGLISRITGVPDAAAIGLATFSFGLEPTNPILAASLGTYVFEVAVVIEDDNSARKIEARIPGLELQVLDSNSDGVAGVFGEIPAGQILHFWADTGSIQVSGQLTNQSDNGLVTLSNGGLTFNATGVLDKLKADPTTGTIWDNILGEFDGGGDYSYAIFVKQVSGPENARFGTKNSVPTFFPLPCATSAEIDGWFGPQSSTSSATSTVTPPSASGKPVYGVQGQFSTVGAPGTPGAAPSAFTGCAVTPPVVVTPPPTTTPVVDAEVDEDVEEIEDIVDDILIPGEGEIDDSTIAAVDNAATAAVALATQLVTNINSSSVTTTAAKSQAVKALTTVSKVVQITGNASGASSDPAKAAATRAKGVETVKGVANVLKALDAKLNKTDSSGNKADTLTQVEKDAVKSATRTTVVSTLKLLTSSASKSEKVSVAQSLGEILSATLNLGLALDDEDTATMLDAADAAASEGDDTDDALDKSVPIKPRPVLPSASSIAQDLGVSNEQANAVLVELAKAINPADVVIGGKSAAETLLEGLLAALGSIPGGSNYDPDNGNTTVTIGGNNNSEQLGRVSSTERDIPARAVSANVVSSTFPDGIRVRANGSVVLTSDRIATIMVPAPYDPVNFYSDLTNLGTVTTGDDGSINIDKTAFPVNFNFSGTFDYTGTITGGDAVSRTRLNEPESGADESDPDYIYTVTFRDGTRQRIQPYIDAQAFIDSVRGRNLTVYTNRNSGVVTVNGKQFRPSYFLDPHSSTTLQFWNDRADAFGIAYRPIDINEDGIVDYQIITEDGVQVAYGLQ